MTGAPPGGGPPTDSEVDAGWDDLLGDPPPVGVAGGVPAGTTAPRVPPPVVPLIPQPATAPAEGSMLEALLQPASPPGMASTAGMPQAAPPAQAASSGQLALNDLSTGAEAAGPRPTEPAKTEPAKTEPATAEPAKTEPATVEPATVEPAPAGPATAGINPELLSGAVSTTTAETARIERSVRATGRLGAEVVEDDELGAAHSGRRPRVVTRPSQRDDEPAATAGSISVADGAEPEEAPTARPKVALRGSKADENSSSAAASPAASPPPAGSPWTWIGLIAVGAMIVGGLYFVQSSMRGRERQAGDAQVRATKGDGRAKSTKSAPQRAAARDERGGREGAARSPGTGPGRRAETDPSELPHDDEGGSAGKTEEPPDGGTVVGGAGGPDVTPPAPSDPSAPAAAAAGAGEEDAAAGKAADPNTAAKAPVAAPRPTGSDPRAVPEGTSPAAASAFKKIAVTAGDGPPVGAIGATGIHVDDIALGDEWASSRCGGESGRFSIAADRPVNVCLRIVHQREDEQLGVAWQRDGRTVRRSKIKVPDLHAYRTRAYLALRKEYVGHWTVRITSADGAELASASFDVVE